MTDTEQFSATPPSTRVTSFDIPTEPAHPNVSWLLVIAAGIVAFLWLSIRLDARYLWQDEAMTAVMGNRLYQLGRPLGYDGKNLITMDTMGDVEADAFPPTTKSVDRAIEYYAQRKDFKPDTTWTGHPWLQFILAGASTQTFGNSTLAARLPFVVAAALAVALLAEWLQRLFNSRLIALLAILLLLANVYWFAHMRQCRYYALSALFTLAMMRFYWGWRQELRWNGVLFIASAWLLFQSDFGTFFPVLASLIIHAFFDPPKQLLKFLGVFIVIALSVAPFVEFYRIYDRLRGAGVPWSLRFLGEIFQINQYVFPLILVGYAYWELSSPNPRISRSIRTFLITTLLFAIGSVAWLTVTAPFPYHRGVVALTPLASALVAWTIVDIIQRLVKNRTLGATLASLITALLIVSPILSTPLSVFLPWQLFPKRGIGFLVRPELNIFRAEILGSSIPDPNRKTIEFLAERIKPGDEVAINYEDIPAMFHLDLPIRGGVTCFRMGYPANTPPRFIILRKSVNFFPYQWAVIDSFLDRCQLKPVETDIPDSYWGYCPDPLMNYLELGEPKNQAIVLNALVGSNPPRRSP